MKRVKWPITDTAQLEIELKKVDGTSRAERAKRIQFIQGELGPIAEMLLVGGITAMFVLEKLTHSFVAGNLISAILLTQVFIEDSLGVVFMLGGDDATAQSGFAQLTKKLSQMVS